MFLQPRTICRRNWYCQRRPSYCIMENLLLGCLWLSCAGQRHTSRSTGKRDVSTNWILVKIAQLREGAYGTTPLKCRTVALKVLLSWLCLEVSIFTTPVEHDLCKWNVIFSNATDHLMLCWLVSQQLKFKIVNRSGVRSKIAYAQSALGLEVGTYFTSIVTSQSQFLTWTRTLA